MDTMIKDAIKLLKHAFDRGDSIFLHELIWNLDAKHHAILDTNELDTIVKEIGGLQKSYTQKGIELSRLESGVSDFLTQDDIDNAMQVYLAKFFPNQKK
jgi:hypothetical protein